MAQCETNEPGILPEGSCPAGTPARTRSRALLSAFPLLCLGLVLCGNQAATSAPGYLLAVGPAPLRFQSVRIRSAEVVEALLAETKKEEPPPVSEPLPGTEDVSVTTLGPTPDPGQPEDWEDLGTKLPDISPEEMMNVSLSAAAAKEAAVVPPQLFLRFFGKKTVTGGTNNAPAVRVIAPIEFNPPQPLVFPPSSATYSTPAQ